MDAARGIAAAGLTTATSSRARRTAEGIAFVGLWIALGLLFHLDANEYLLAGVPLTILFQIIIRKQPLHALWVREAPRFTLDKAGWKWAIVFGIVPVRVVVSGIHEHNYIVALWGVSAACGAVAAAYAIRAFRRETFRSLLLCAATAGTIGTTIMMGAAFLGHRRVFVSPLNGLQVFMGSLLEYFPGSFLLEEVSFRGVLDSHLHHPDESSHWTSAILVSALWGLWHFPIVSTTHPFGTVTELLFIHCAIGVPLSIFWRRSGNLAVPAFSHAMIDAVRNALLG